MFRSLCAGWQRFLAAVGTYTVALTSDARFTVLESNQHVKINTAHEYSILNSQSPEENIVNLQKQLRQERERVRRLERFRSMATSSVLHALFSDTLESPLEETDISELHLTADIYQVVIGENFHPGAKKSAYPLAELLPTTGSGKSGSASHLFEHITLDGRDIILLKGSDSLQHLEVFLTKMNSQPLQEGSPLESTFLTVGRPVYSLNDIHLSYEDAVRLLNRRFYCARYTHYLDYLQLPPVHSAPLAARAAAEDVQTEGSAESPELLHSLLDEYLEQFFCAITASNRRLLAQTFTQLERALQQADLSPVSVRGFLIDLYLSVREKIQSSYQTLDFPFVSNSSVISVMQQGHYLYELIQCLSNQFTIFINVISNPSRNTVLDEVLDYIDHNYQRSLKLEDIAPLFGYSSAYLGKLFTKLIGESFKSYLDHRRIQHAKELLADKKWKVYAIAEQVGYKNVDYFHKKFRQYTGMSPLQFREQALESKGKAKML